MMKREYSINMTEIEAELNSIKKESTELYNKKLKKEFVNKISSLRGRIEKYKIKDEQEDYEKIEVPDSV
jgi:succinate dehydrogenase/fumarate reductase flavoprotein subunit